MKLHEFKSNDEILSDLLSDCKPYLKAQIKNGVDISQNYIVRGIRGNVVRIKKRPPRKRYSPRGARIFHYWYDKSNDSALKDRRTNVFPSTINELHEGQPYNNYIVLYPIGNYKLVWSEGIKDFNYNQYSPASTHLLLEQMIVKLEDIVEKYNDKISDNDIKKVEELSDVYWSTDIEPYEGFVELIDGMRNVLRDSSFPSSWHLKDKIEELRRKFLDAEHYVDQYIISRERSTTGPLEKSMEGCEVAVYAPNGVYYLNVGKHQMLADKIQEKL